MSRYIEVRNPPIERQAFCDGGQEHHFTEAAVMIAFAMHLFENGAESVALHPDGEHCKRHDVKASLEAHGFHHVRTQGKTKYSGHYARGAHTITVTSKPGLGDVVAIVAGQTMVGECKGGVINSRHAGQVSRLRRGLCEIVGLLMARPLETERHVAIVPATETTRRLATRMLPRLKPAGIEVALVYGDGAVEFLDSAVEAVPA